MSTIRLTEQTHDQVRNHLFSSPGEHFGFLLAEHAEGSEGPIFLVDEFHEIPDTETTVTDSGWEVTTPALLEAINRAIKSEKALIEVHNHPGGWSTFSSIDRQGFEEFVPYVLDSLPDRPYAATVWTDAGTYGEYFLQNGASQPVRSITVVGDQLRQLAAGPSSSEADARFSRQEPWFTRAGQRQLGQIRVAIVGLGGTGSQVAQNLAYLGVRDFVLIDSDVATETNLNRLITATPADLETPKTILARRLIRSVSPEARVRAISNELNTREALAQVKATDLVFGCVDNDGARLVLNELCLAYLIPLIDLGVGIVAHEGTLEEAGGRVSILVHGGPCLFCMGEIDVDEAQYFLKNPQERKLAQELGYVEGLDQPAPAVVSLNAAVAACAANELAIWISGLRPPHPFTELDLIGRARSIRSQWLTPRTVEAKDGCVQCAFAGTGEWARIDRYAGSESVPGRSEPQPQTGQPRS